MKSQKRIGYFLMIVTIFVLGCDVSTLVAPQQIPTPVPGIVNTIVAQTAAAAATQTQALIPPTITPSPTPFPTPTASVTPSPTPTFIFRFPTAAPTEGIPGVTTSNATWSCKLARQTPPDSTHVSPGASFDTAWTVTNTGDITWLRTSVDIVYLKGSKLSPQNRYDTKADTNIGNDFAITVPMMAPSSAGTYTTTWALQSGNTTFCPVSLTIIVP